TPSAQLPELGAAPMKISSPAFEPSGSIPTKYTCEGDNIPPALSFSDVPSAAKSLALIVDDPHSPDPAAPTRTWARWVVFGIPPSTSTIPEGGTLPTGARQGMNDWQKPSYGGPCPPIGRHRYFFKVYALDADLSTLANTTPSK